MIDTSKYEVWFVTGSQNLYGEETLKKVESHSRIVSSHLNEFERIPISIVFKEVLTSPEGINSLFLEAGVNDNCIGVICWMHTFSPAKMWINGLKNFSKPLLHFHTQYNADIPWSSIDMDFMNLNQSAHGGREFGYICSKLKIKRKVVTGHWKDEEVLDQIAIWTRVASSWHDSQTMKIARFGDNMRQVAVTEGNKVNAQIQFGYSVDGYGMGDLVKVVNDVSDSQVNQLIDKYIDSYNLANKLQRNGEKHHSLRDAAKIEIGLKHFLELGGYTAFTTTFENLTGLKQLPGIAVQRLMEQGYGFGAEGDWKTAALVRTMKVMANGLDGGNSFMEDYTYHLDPSGMKVLGAHMLEICPSISKEKAKCEIHPLSIGSKDDPVRLVFNADQGEALNATMIDLGDRFRMIANTVSTSNPDEDLPNLPVARALWKPHPNLKTAASSWIIAGGGHHTCYSQNLNSEFLEDFAEMAGIELILIDETSTISQIKKELNWNDSYYQK